MAPEALALAARADSWAERLSERVNPMLVKEVRQALRSRFFRVIFLISLMLCTLAAVIVLGVVTPMMRDKGQEVTGEGLLTAILSCASLCSVGLVPFAAFISMNGESDDNALDLLTLSSLPPRKIVLGKLLSALLQALILYAVCLPYVCLAWAMGGVEPFVTGASFVSSLTLSLLFSSAAIAASSLSRTRWVRILLMVFFGFFLFNMGPSGLMMALAFYSFTAASGGGPTGLMASGVSSASLLFALVQLPLILIALAFACDRLAHREQSTSTGLRFVATGIALAGALVDVLWMASQGTQSSPYVLMIVLALLAIPLGWTVTEREPLPLGVRAHPPRGFLRGLWMLPHLAGGGRAAWLATILIGGVCLVHALACSVTRGAWNDDALQGIVLGLFTWIYLLLPSVLFSPLSRRTSVRSIARVAVCFFPLIAWLGSALVCVLISGPGSEPLRNPANPVYMFESMQGDGHIVHEMAWAVLIGVALLTLLLNAWRMGRGAYELWRVQRAARA